MLGQLVLKGRSSVEELLIVFEKNTSKLLDRAFSVRLQLSSTIQPVEDVYNCLDMCSLSSLVMVVLSSSLVLMQQCGRTKHVLSYYIWAKEELPVEVNFLHDVHLVIHLLHPHSVEAHAVTQGERLCRIMC